ncbi:MAG: alcohol dehydrogenase catalytic domain-containing protein [Gammaproteobacteria bacterium]|nr:alcohol dehydrogenase catalytic domain-containing protein [Gammaproteobacteria bacterium]NNJ85135.1 alcohol dehydrogenase catalytic domain-containing protein [Gammaproteobacteria bacterium]
MRALYFDHTLQLRYDYPLPSPRPDEALIRTRLAGICNTDLEMLRGYGGGFTGVLGHEFVGEVVRTNRVSHTIGTDLIGQRVVGEINCYCGKCPTCQRGDRAHCPSRTTLGIRGRDGAMADFFTLPIHLLHPVPDSVTDEQAVFAEPLAAACEIIEQVHIRSEDRVVVLGDGKLGLLIAQVLQLTGCNLLVTGHHSHKLEILAAKGIPTQLATASIEPGADIVIEATGSASGFAAARSLVRPRGTLVLKSTIHGKVPLDLSGIVVDEITLIGSRCGPFAQALRLLAEGLVDVEPLIHRRFSLDDGPAAFRQVASGALKVLLSP